MINIKRICISLLNILFFIILLVILLNIIFNNKVNLFKYNILFIIFGTIIFIFALISLYKFILKRFNNEKRYIIISLSILIILHFCFGFLFMVDPSWDFGSVYQAAIDSVEGITRISDNPYFYQYTNNLGLVFILKVIYKIINVLGICSYNVLGIILNIICIDVSILLTYFVIKSLFGTKKALFILIFMCIYTPFITYTPIFYTDTISLPFTILPIFLYLKSQKCDDKLKRNIFYLLMGLTIFIGMSLKFTVIIILIALIIERILHYQVKDNLLLISFVALPVILLTLLQNFVVGKLFDQEKVNSAQFPISHWIMMGLEYKGGYWEDDVAYTASFPTKEEKTNANISMIKQRFIDHIKNNTLIKFYANKISYTWGDGTYFAPEKLRRNPVREGIYHQFILAGGKYSKIYAYFAQFEHLSLLFFMIFSVFTKNSSEKRDVDIFTKLIFIGSFIFFIIWETRSRYIINLIPIFMVIASFGIEKCSCILNNLMLKYKGDRVND